MYNIPFGKPIIGLEEREAVMKVMDGSILVHGPVATKFEKDFGAFTGSPNSVSVSSCHRWNAFNFFCFRFTAQEMR